MVVHGGLVFLNGPPPRLRRRPARRPLEPLVRLPVTTFLDGVAAAAAGAATLLPPAGGDPFSRLREKVPEGRMRVRGA
jgi:hypothetical protein